LYLTLEPKPSQATWSSTPIINGIHYILSAHKMKMFLTMVPILNVPIFLALPP
jgi:hypothetical protein